MKRLLKQLNGQYMTNARDFIRKELLPYLWQKRGSTNNLDATCALARAIEYVLWNDHKWDKPEQGVVDEEAFKAAKDKHDYCMDIIPFLQAYEQTKLEKATISKKERVEFPPLPSQHATDCFVEGSSMLYIHETLNQLIDCIASLYKRGK